MHPVNKHWKVKLASSSSRNNYNELTVPNRYSEFERRPFIDDIDTVANNYICD